MSTPGQALPTGTVTFLFTDIEGSTRLLQALGERYAELLDHHRRLIREAIASGGGAEVGTEGDSFFAAFPTAHGALDAVVGAQRALAAAAWPGAVDVRVRMGLHTGESRLEGASYVGIDVHRAARVSAAAHGGQVLLSSTTAELVRDRLPAGVRLRDLRRHNLKDLARSEHLYQLVIDGLPADFPPLRSLVATPHNLPILLSSFVGRELELLEVAELIQANRLVTLTGSGGSGKSRLATEVGRAALEEFPDGVWLVELASLTDPALVPQALATVLGVQTGASQTRTIEEATDDYLRSRHCLLILDNCEHVLGGSAALAARLLSTCPSVHILVTSREPLGVMGEVQFPVPSLDVPQSGRELPPEQLREHAAIRLLEDRAADLRPGFAVTANNAAAVTEIVRRLDGIPLAIELAAARIKFLSPAEVAARLDDRFRLLHGSQRTALPRHQTLRAAMDWSYDLLSGKERLALERLSVFAGGWTIDGAEFVVAGDAIEPGGSDVVELLASLVDKSLVVATERDGRTRYRALETVREYAWEKLVERGEHDGVVLRHRLWCLELAERAAAHFWTAAMPEWLSALETEHDNLRAVLDRATGPGGTEVGLRICGALWPFWDFRGHIREGLERLRQLLARPDVRQASTEARARAMDAAAWLAGLQGDLDQALRWSRAALDLWRELGDRDGIAWSLVRQGTHLWNLREAEAEAQLTESLLAAGETDNLVVAAWARLGLGHLAMMRGETARSQALLEEGLEISQRLGIPWAIAWANFGRGMVAVQSGEYQQARKFFRESLALRWQLRDRRAVSDSLGALASVAGLIGDASEAALLDGAAESLRRATGAELLPWLQERLDEGLAAARQALGDPAFVTARHRGLAMPLAQVVEQILAGREAPSAASAPT